MTIMEAVSKCKEIISDLEHALWSDGVFTLEKNMERNQEVYHSVIDFLTRQNFRAEDIDETILILRSHAALR
jgi:hypothetical protein